MSLSSEQVERLCKPLSLEDHYFNDGLVYLTESGVAARLDEIDPSWEFQIKSIEVQGDACVVWGALKVAGVVRESVGMDSDKLSRDGKRVVNEKQKAATTDALKRCARLFGIGRYLLKAKGISNLEELRRWLEQEYSDDSYRSQPFTKDSWGIWLEEVRKRFPSVSSDQIQAVIGTARDWNAKGGTYQSALDALAQAMRKA